MARAAAPMLRGLRVATRTTRRRSNSARAGKSRHSTAGPRQKMKPRAAQVPSERVGAAAHLDGDPFYFGHFVGGPATAFAAGTGVFDTAEGNGAFVVNGGTVEVHHA